MVSRLSDVDTVPLLMSRLSDAVILCCDRQAIRVGTEIPDPGKQCTRRRVDFVPRARRGYPPEVGFRSCYYHPLIHKKFQKNELTATLSSHHPIHKKFQIKNSDGTTTISTQFR